MTNYKKYLWLYPMLVLLVGLIGGTKTVEVNPDSTTYHVLAAQVNHPIATPLILVPGTYGTQNRFDEMLATLKTTTPDLSVEKITVHTDGTLKVTGKIKKSSQHPVFVIAFEEAEDGIEAISQQAQWFQQALHSILDFYDFETYNFVGHSNGGLVFTEYLEYLQTTDEPQVASMITLGTPYNDVVEEENQNYQSANVTEWLNHYLVSSIRQTNFEMINIAGSLNNQATDGTVPLASVQMGAQIFQNKTEYQEKIVSASHSNLTENEEVLELLSKVISDNSQNLSA